MWITFYQLCNETVTSPVSPVTNPHVSVSRRYWPQTHENESKTHVSTINSTNKYNEPSHKQIIKQTVVRKSSIAPPNNNRFSSDRPLEKKINISLIHIAHIQNLLQPDASSSLSPITDISGKRNNLITTQSLYHLISSIPWQISPYWCPF